MLIGDRVEHAALTVLRTQGHQSALNVQRMVWLLLPEVRPSLPVLYGRLVGLEGRGLAYVAVPRTGLRRRDIDALWGAR